jgi:hypothetical protein
MRRGISMGLAFLLCIINLGLCLSPMLRSSSFWMSSCLPDGVGHLTDLLLSAHHCSPATVLVGQRSPQLPVPRER